MHDFFASFGLLAWKPWVGALLLPPVPLLGLLLLSWWWQRRRPLASTLLILFSLPALWLSHCQGMGALLEQSLSVSASLSSTRIAELRRSLDEGKAAVVVLGGGARELASEYGEAHLENRSMERLHYGLWLARQLRQPLLFSGGAGWAMSGPASEAAVAGRIASRDYGRPIRWLETESRDTRGNARHSLALLARDGVQQVVLVTHGYHMQRALRAFETEVARNGFAIQITAAPMGGVTDRLLPFMQRWTPTVAGYRRVREALHEWLGLLAGA